MDNWAFVVVAYAITTAVLVGYILVLRARLRAAESEIEHEKGSERAEDRAQGPAAHSS